MDITKLKSAYASQKCASRKRGIEFSLTFDEWLNWWQQTGKLHLRGKSKGCYQMCRINDVGPYTLGNIYCDTVEANSKLPIEGKPRNPEASMKAVKTRLANGHPADPFIEVRKCIVEDSESRAIDAIKWAYETRSARRVALRKFGVSQRIWERCLPIWEASTGLLYDVPKRATGDSSGGKQNAKPVLTPDGMFPSAKSAATALNIPHSTVVYRCMNNSQGFMYI